MLPDFKNMRLEWLEAPLPAAVVLCGACETMEACPNGKLPDGWATEMVAGVTRAFCPDCAIDLPDYGKGHGLFEASVYAGERPLVAVVHAAGRWFGVVEPQSARVLAHHFGEFGFWRVKGSGQ
jgi:hypothetical protein